MSGFGKKLLGIIGLEEVEDDNEDYYEDGQSEQPADYPEEEYQPLDEPSYTSRNYASSTPKRTQQHEQANGSYSGGYTSNAGHANNNYGNRKPRPVNSSFVGPMDSSNLSILIYHPTSYDDTQTIIDNLKSNRPILVNLDELDTEVAQRILDFISGAVYALSGNIRKAARNIFMVTPSSVDVTTNLTGETMSATAGDFDGHYFSDGEM